MYGMKQDLHTNYWVYIRAGGNKVFEEFLIFMFKYQIITMKVLQINTRYYNGGSTGRITFDLKKVMEANGIESYVAFGFGYNLKDNEKENVYRIESDRELFVSKLWTKATGHHGFNNKRETRRLLAWIDEIKPDIIHMHNIHNHYVNVRMLLEYISTKNIPCVLTMHDCWTFTGHCAYFDFSGCDKWKTGCNHCPSLRDYPKTFAPIDPSSWNYKMKKKLFAPLNITFVSPSNWLCDLQQLSFLKNKPCIVINNGIDLDVFKPVQSNVRKEYGIGDRKMILAVAGGLALRKGREYLLELPNLLNDDEVLVLVGLEKGQESLLPKTDKVIGIHCTKTSDELVGLYSEADVFINPTLEDNFPTTNLEALACGTPIVTFNTGGSAEVVTSETGIVVDKGDMDSLLSAIRTILGAGKEHYITACRKKAENDYNKNKQYDKYVKLYETIRK